MKNLVNLLFVAVVAGCASSSIRTTPSTNHEFADFLRDAESYAAQDKSYLSPDIKPPITGSNFTVTSFTFSRSTYTMYQFAETPCVSRESLAEELVKLGFEKQPPGPFSYSFHVLHDTFHSTRNRNRSVNAEFWRKTGFQCLHYLFIDY